jgi:hypothetical protein
MFDLDRFIADCRAALVEDATHKSVREVVARAVSDPGAVLKSLGDPQRSGVQKIYHSPDLTILNVIWGPQMAISPHNHQMWAVIGIYTGREDNIFWRRLPNRKVEAAGARADGLGQLAYRGTKLRWRELAGRPVRAQPKAMRVKATTMKPPAANHPWRRLEVGVGREYWRAVKARGRAMRAAARLTGRDSGRPPLRSGLPPSRPASRGNRTTNNKPTRGHSLVS